MAKSQSNQDINGLESPTSTTIFNTDIYQKLYQNMMGKIQELQESLHSLTRWLNQISPEQVKTIPMEELQSNPSLWEAYIRGWQSCIASMPEPPTLQSSNSPLQTIPVIETIGKPRPLQQPTATKHDGLLPLIVPLAVNLGTSVQGSWDPQNQNDSVGKQIIKFTKDLKDNGTSVAGVVETSRDMCQYMTKPSMDNSVHSQEMKRQNNGQRSKDLRLSTSQQFRMLKTNVDFNSTQTTSSIGSSVPASRNIFYISEDISMEVDDQ